MENPFLRHPAPDFAQLERILRGEEKPKRVHLVELLINDPVLRDLTEQFTDDPWIPLSEETIEPYRKQIVSLFYRLGYDSVSAGPVWNNHPGRERLFAKGGSELPRGQRGRRWVDEHQGLISNWEEFERFPWDDITPGYEPIEMVAQSLPDGMKITVMNGGVFSHVHMHLLGTEGLFYLLYDNPELVAAVFERWGQIVYDFTESIVDMDEVGAVWSGDDLGFTTSTMISPQALRQHALPWYKRFADLAHDHGKTIWFHCCGNVYVTGIIDDLIDYVHLDAFHSFQDPILPIAEFQEKYGDRLAGLGGVDMDKLCRLDEAPLREYMRDIIERCMPKGRFAFGSGNTISSYVPTDHYVWMIEESRRWGSG